MASTRNGSLYIPRSIRPERQGNHSFLYLRGYYLSERVHAENLQGNIHFKTYSEDLDAEDITTPGRPDDADIDMPGNANGTEGWLHRIGIAVRSGIFNTSAD